MKAKQEKKREIFTKSQASGRREGLSPPIWEPLNFRLYFQKNRTKKLRAKFEKAWLTVTSQYCLTHATPTWIKPFRG
jgi:hypothetical protein